ncbi:DUF551 domain-containing protein [Salmonella enterica]|nr:DUF551 domain-containing protein [Salmonella enterica]EJK6225094.1 DUF551 domain-containing protein [Salmonella enterica]
MTTITKERLLKIQHWRETYGADSNVMLPAEEAAELARIALASLEAEPVAYMVGTQLLENMTQAIAYKADTALQIKPLYTAPPAPVSVPAAMEMDDDFDSAFEHGKAVGWNAYRAAMLQAEPVSNSDELPLDYLQGHKDGLEWAAQLAEANHPQTGDWLYDDPIDLARAIRKGPDMPTVQGGNYPVTPDGWISCSERMPDDGQHVIIICDGAFVLYAQYRDGEFFDVVRDGDEFFETQSRNVTHWMPLPEPPQEVNRG